MSNDVTLACQMKMAERELGAFFQVVFQLHGPEEAEISAQDWLDELELRLASLNRRPANGGQLPLTQRIDFLSE
jgi:hypothetical protein